MRESPPMNGLLFSFSRLNARGDQLAKNSFPTLRVSEFCQRLTILKGGWPMRKTPRDHGECESAFGNSRCPFFILTKLIVVTDSSAEEL